MTEADPKNWRLHLLFGLLLAALAALAGRLAAFQAIYGERMAALAAGQQEMSIDLPARRGNIYANHAGGYQLMATSAQRPAAFIDPALVPDDKIAETAARVAACLDLSPAEIEATIRRRRRSRFVWLRKDLDEPSAQAVRDLKIRAVGITYRWQRVYPNGALAAHVVGFVGAENTGLEGIELKLDDYLRGADGSNAVLSDAARRPIWNRQGRYQPPADGAHVYLTIDTYIQAALERVLADTQRQYRAESAVGVVVEPATGRVLAMASLPEFDLNAFASAEADHRRNRCITDIYEPGSIFKPFTASVALDDGAVAWGQEIDCHNGAYRCRPGRTLHDAHPYGMLSVEAIVYKSSNIGMALIGERLGSRRLHAALESFGFGQATGVLLPGEQEGMLRPLKRWTPDSIWSIPMGHEIGVTALQVAMAFSAIANGGNLMHPILVDRLAAPDGTEIDRTQPTVRRRVLSEAVARRFVTDALAQTPVIGTARDRGNLEHWSSFGKTGTAQIPPYKQGDYVGSYIAGAPVDTPRLVCLISVRRPDKSLGYYGGVVAAPAVKRVLESSLSYLQIPPEF